MAALENGKKSLLDDEEPDEAVLTVCEQADGRKVSRLPGGKVVLVDIQRMAMVADGERWRVRLRHKETFALAEPLDLAREALIFLIEEYAEPLRRGERPR